MEGSNPKYTELRRSRDNQWTLIEVEGKYYYVRYDGSDLYTVETKANNLVNTMYRDLAEKMFDELVAYGYNAESKPTILNIHSFC